MLLVGESEYSEATQMSNDLMTVNPTLVNMPTLPSSLSATVAPIPTPSIPTPSSIPLSPAASIISRPTKRYVRPRAKTDQEKKSRLEERKLANRAAAKQSRERQKKAMEEAQRENEQLKQENQALLARLASLEQRMALLESGGQDIATPSPTTSPPSNTTATTPATSATGDFLSMTHQPARLVTEPQCPIPMLTTSPSTRQQTSLTSTQATTIAYILQTLMQSLMLSIAFRIPLTSFSQDQRTFHSRLLYSFQTLQMKTMRRSLWMQSSLGNATPNLFDLRGARRGAVVSRSNVKSILLRSSGQRRVIGKDVLRLVNKSRLHNNGSCIRLIVKKKNGKRKFSK